MPGVLGLSCKEEVFDVTKNEPAILFDLHWLGPFLALSTYPELTDERLLNKLRYKGIDKFIAYRVDLDAVAERYAESFRNTVDDLKEVEDLRVLDFNGHQIMANFSLAALGDPIKFGD